MGAGRRRPERQPVPEHHAPVSKRFGEHGVGVLVAAIGLGKHDVERHDGCACVPEPRDEPGDHVPAPRPLAISGEASLVDVHDDDAIARRLRSGPPQRVVVDSVVQADGERRAVQREDRDD